MQELDLRAALMGEFKFRAVRSSGPGGQHVNKVSSKVVLSWDVMGSAALGQEQQARIMQQLSNRINQAGILQMDADQSRSQLANKEEVVERLFQLIFRALQPVRPRKKSKVPYSIVLKRLNNKKKNADQKKLRAKVR